MSIQDCNVPNLDVAVMQFCRREHLLQPLGWHLGAPNYNGRGRCGAIGITKRFLDIVIAATSLILGVPVFLLIAVAIRLDSPGPWLFRQKRRGLNGRPFWLLKFRSVHVQYTDPQATVQTGRNDRRMTRVGACIRRHSLDELPQLLNVLRGDMSIVGPRPHAFGTAVDGKRLDVLVENYADRCQVRPGITGLAQVSGCRGPLDTIKKVQVRIDYHVKLKLVLTMTFCTSRIGLLC